MNQEIKTCSSCKQTLPLSSFGKDVSRPDGLKSYCKTCRSKKGKKYNSRPEIKERNAAYQRKYYKKSVSTPEGHEAMLWRSIKKKTGWTKDMSEQAWEEQGGRCAICNVELVIGKTKEDLSSQDLRNHDHCHDTNEPRALLCASCNKGLGHFGDNPRKLMNAIEYLHQHSCKSPWSKDEEGNYQLNTTKEDK